MRWARQHKDYGLGNFTNLWYTLQRDPMPVYFESDYVREIYQNMDERIQALDTKPEGEPILCSSMINRSGDRPDWAYIMKNHFSSYLNLPKNLIMVLANGCANPDKRHTKDPGQEIYRHTMEVLREKGYFCVFVGSRQDYEANRKLFDLADYQIIDSPIETAELIKQCAAVIMNDTGWYHFAGLHNKRGIIFWKDTDPVKNASPNKNFIYI